MTWRSIKLPNNKVLGVLNHSVDSIHYAVFSVDHNQNPGKVESVRNYRLWRTHKKLRSSMIFLIYQRVILEGRSKQRLQRFIDLRKATTLTCPRKGIKEYQYGRNHGCKRPDPRYNMNSYQEKINLREASMIGSTSCPWAWTQSSRSTPTS